MSDPYLSAVLNKKHTQGTIGKRQRETKYGESQAFANFCPTQAKKAGEIKARTLTLLYHYLCRFPNPTIYVLDTFSPLGSRSYRLPFQA